MPWLAESGEKLLNIRPTQLAVIGLWELAKVTPFGSMKQWNAIVIHLFLGISETIN